MPKSNCSSNQAKIYMLRFLENSLSSKYNGWDLVGKADFILPSQFVLLPAFQVSRKAHVAYGYSKTRIFFQSYSIVIFKFKPRIHF